jgi:ABC-type spermidine/putrescine transport system permease subunit II
MRTAATNAIAPPALGALRFKTLVLALLMAPIIVPHIVTALRQFFFYPHIGIIYTSTRIILAHTTLAIPFVALTVSATYAGFNPNPMRAGRSRRDRARIRRVARRCDRVALLISGPT